MLGPIHGALFTPLFACPNPTHHPGLSRDVTSQKPSLNPRPLAFPLHIEQTDPLLLLLSFHGWCAPTPFLICERHRFEGMCRVGAIPCVHPQPHL